jgi:hypothetical protein
MVAEKESIKTGDMVSWNSSGGAAQGRVEHIMRDGVLGIPNSKFKINASKEDPAVLIRIYQNGEETETLVGHKMSTLRKNFTKHLNGQHDQSTHAPHVSQGGPDEHRGSDDDPKHMDSMDLGSGRPKRKRELTMAERILINRIASPATNYASRSTQGLGGYQPTAVIGGPKLTGGTTGYKPDPANNPS